MAGLSQEFVSEAEEILDGLNRELFKLDAMAGGAPYDPDAVNSIFRGAHSLKGLAGMFNFTELQEFAHKLENLLDALRLGKVQLAKPLVDALFKSSDLMKSLVEARAGDGPLPSTAVLLEEIRRIIEAKPEISGHSPAQLAGIDPAMLATLSEYEEHRLNENLKNGSFIHKITAVFDLMTFDTALGEVIEAAKTKGEVVTTLPSGAASTADQIAFDILVGARISRDELAELVKNVPGLVITTIGGGKTADAAPPPHASAPKPAETARAATEEKPETGGDGGQQASARSAAQTVRVHIGKLDYLMNIVGDLVIQRAEFQRLAEQFKSQFDAGQAGIDFDKAIRSFTRRINELQNGVMSTRLVPIGSVFERLATIIRQTSRSLGKDVRIEMSGVDTELDKLIIEELSDPLMHIVRNAIDHGIEPAAERQAAGKPPQGLIRLNAFPEGNKVIVQISDDGKGIDAERVYQKALSLGLVDAGQPVSRAEKLDLVFLPGLSTKTEVSDLSGRGVGMDVVKNNISRLSGVIQIDSKPGQGTTLTLTLPITLAIIKALLVESRSRTYAVPIYNVLECVRIPNDRVQRIEKRAAFELRERSVPMIDLASYFRHELEAPAEGAYHYIIVVGLAEQRLGIRVDRLAGQQDVVIKPLGDLLKQAPGIAGAAELGGQKTVLVLDVGRILEEVMIGGSHTGDRAA